MGTSLNQRCYRFVKLPSVMKMTMSLFKFDVQVTVHRDKFLIIKPTRCTISQIYFGKKFYMFRTVPLSNIRSFFTVHTAVLYVIEVCWQLASRIRMELGQFLCPSSGVFQCTYSNCILHTGLLTACKLSTNLYDVYHCCVYSEKLLTMDRGTVRNV